jgi:hypothetical protein
MKFKITLFFINCVVAAVIIPVVLHHIAATKEITIVDHIVIGSLSWLILTVLELYFFISNIDEREKREFALLEAQGVINNKLLGLRNSFFSLLQKMHGNSDAYLLYFENKLDSLAKEISLATSGEESIAVNQAHLDFSNHLFASAFNGDTEDSFRAIHFLKDNDFFWGLHSREYFKRIFELVASKKIKQVYRIMVYSNDQEKQNDKTIRLIKFHALNKRYSYKLLSRTKYDTLLADFGLQETTEDFGIYSDKYLYLARVHQNDHIEGRFTKNNIMIKNHMHCFAKCWEVGEELTTLNISEQKYTIKDLYGD